MIKGEKIVFFGGSDWWYHNPNPEGTYCKSLLIMAMKLFISTLSH